MTAYRKPTQVLKQPATSAPHAAWQICIWATPALVSAAAVGLLVWWHGGSLAGTASWPDQQVLFLALNSAFAVLPSALWSGVTLFGDSTVLLALLAPLLFVQPRAWAALLASLPAGALMSASFKHLAGVPRPAAVLKHDWFNLIGPALHFKSFPSGHTISAFAAAAAVLATCAARPRHPRDWALIAGGVLMATLVALSRVAIGAHWPLDLAAGAAIGWLAGLSGVALANHPRWWQWLFLGRGRPATGALLVLWGVLLWLQPRDTMTCVVVGGVAGACAVAVGLSLLATGTTQVPQPGL